MKIGIIGSGSVGSSLGLHLAGAGHRVKFSSRHPDQLEKLVLEAGENTSAGTVQEAAGFGEAIILSVPFWAVGEVANKIGPQVGKIIIETTNPYPDRDGKEARKIRKSNTPSSQFVASLFPGAYVLKAFNTIYFKHLKEQAFRPDEGRRVVPYAGDHRPSLEILEKLITDIGFQGFYVGKLSESKIMDPNQPLYSKDLPVNEIKEILKSRAMPH